jgi:hypothetical protein
MRWRRNISKISFLDEIWFIHNTITTITQQPLTWGWAPICGVHPYVRGCWVGVVNLTFSFLDFPKLQYWQYTCIFFHFLFLEKNVKKGVPWSSHANLMMIFKSKIIEWKYIENLFAISFLLYENILKSFCNMQK